jgi:hypothetical protein
MIAEQIATLSGLEPGSGMSVMSGRGRGLVSTPAGCTIPAMTAASTLRELPTGLRATRASRRRSSPVSRPACR